jgi:hypothetical protein
LEARPEPTTRRCGGALVVKTSRVMVDEAEQPHLPLSGRSPVNGDAAAGAQFALSAELQAMRCGGGSPQRGDAAAPTESTC